MLPICQDQVSLTTQISRPFPNLGRIPRHFQKSGNRAHAVKKRGSLHVYGTETFSDANTVTSTNHRVPLALQSHVVAGRCGRQNQQTWQELFHHRVVRHQRRQTVPLLRHSLHTDMHTSENT